MKVEVRNDRVVLDGYVNVHSRDSRVLPSVRGNFVEQIEPRAFERALGRTENVDLLFNHREDRKLGSIQEGNLELREDVIGLRAICTVTDPEVIEKAKNNELRGWSFGFICREDRWEEGQVQRRFVEDLDLLEVSILDMTPAYYSTTVESRGGEDVLREQRFEMPIGDLEQLIEDEELVVDPPMDPQVVETVDEAPADPEIADDPIVEEVPTFDHTMVEFEIEILKMKGRYINESIG